MGNNDVFQFGEQPIYIERNEGNVYVGDYVSKTNEAFADESFELHMFAPQITPPIEREEVGIILNWIARDTDKTDPKRVALLYGSAGVGSTHKPIKDLSFEIGTKRRVFSTRTQDRPDRIWRYRGFEETNASGKTFSDYY